MEKEERRCFCCRDAVRCAPGVLIAGEVKIGGSVARFGFGEDNESGDNVVGEGEGDCEECWGESTAAIVSSNKD